MLIKKEDEKSGYNENYLLIGECEDILGNKYKEYVVPIQKHKKKEKRIARMNIDDYLYDDDEPTTINSKEQTDKKTNTENIKINNELLKDIYNKLNEIYSTLKTIEDVLTKGGE